MSQTHNKIGIKISEGLLLAIDGYITIVNATKNSIAILREEFKNSMFRIKACKPNCKISTQPEHLILRK
jgi:hypothetical protein